LHVKLNSRREDILLFYSINLKLEKCKIQKEEVDQWWEKDILIYRHKFLSKVSSLVHQLININRIQLLIQLKFKHQQTILKEYLGLQTIRLCLNTSIKPLILARSLEVVAEPLWIPVGKKEAVHLALIWTFLPPVCHSITRLLNVVLKFTTLDLINSDQRRH